MVDHLSIYLDEAGDLGFDFNKKNTSRYFIIGLLVFWDDAAHSAMIRAVKRTLKNKLPKNTHELKGSNLSSSIKQYFLKEVNKQANWRLYSGIVDKKVWIRERTLKYSREPEKRILYDEMAIQLFSQLDHLNVAHYVDIVADHCKKEDEIKIFNQAIRAEFFKKTNSRKAKLTIRHIRSQENAGIQAIDIFCSGIWKKYEKADLSWYKEFENKIAAETIM